MSSVSHRVRGNFISALQELVPVLSVKPHQVSAAKHPKRSTKAMAKRSPNDRTSKPHINDRLAGKAR